MNDEVKEDELIKSNRKFFNYLISLRNRDLRKEIENCNWNAILQLIRYFEYEITNLQQENERLKEERENLTHIVANKIIKDYDIDTPLKNQLNEERIKYIGLGAVCNDYKSRIDKAIEYINQHMISKNVWFKELRKGIILYEDGVEELLNILNGGDEYMTSFKDLENIADDLRIQYNQLLELCMYALIRDTKIYNHELDDVNKLKLMNTIRNNLNNDTYTLRNKLIKVWENSGDEE